MNRQQARKSRRQQAGQPSVREISLPLPLAGLFVLARSGQVSNVYAAELENWRSNGVTMILRPGILWQGTASTVFQRIPFEFGGQSAWIEVQPAGISCGAAAFARAFTAVVDWATISESAIIVDKVNKPLRFNGTAWSEQTFTTTTGFNPADFDGVIAHHDRLYFWDRSGTLDFYYGEVGAVQGALTRFPLGRLGSITGSISSMLSLTMDAGHGMNDVLAIFTTTGQMILYEGLDPGDSADWRLLARIDAAAPISPRAVAKVGSDVWMLTGQGVVSVAESSRSSVLALVSQVSKPIADSVMELVEEGGKDWQLFTAADGTFVLINCVDPVEETAQQFIYYTEGQAWATGDMAALDYHNLAKTPHVTGFDGRIGTLKHQSGPETITARWVSSWFDTGQMNAKIAYLHPVIRAKGSMTVRVVTLADNQDTAADILESEQTLTMDPEEPATTVTLDDIIACDAVGQKFQITLEVTATWAELVSMKAALA